MALDQGRALLGRLLTAWGEQPGARAPDERDRERSAICEARVILAGTGNNAGHALLERLLAEWGAQPSNREHPDAGEALAYYEAVAMLQPPDATKVRADIVEMLEREAETLMDRSRLTKDTAHVLCLRQRATDAARYAATIRKHNENGGAP